MWPCQSETFSSQHPFLWWLSKWEILHNSSIPKDVYMHVRVKQTVSSDQCPTRWCVDCWSFCFISIASRNLRLARSGSCARIATPEKGTSVTPTVTFEWLFAKCWPHGSGQLECRVYAACLSPACTQTDVKFAQDSLTLSIHVMSAVSFRIILVLILPYSLQ